MSYVDSLLVIGRIGSNSNEFELNRVGNNKNIKKENQIIDIAEYASSVLCEKCNASPPKLLCQRCKKITHCSEKCQRYDINHNMGCIQTHIVNSNDDIIAIIDKQLNQDVKTFSNDQYHFIYRSDLKTHRKFRIINNPENLALVSGRSMINCLRILAYDQSISKDLVELISFTYKHTKKFGPYEDQKQKETESAFELLKSCVPRITKSGSFDLIAQETGLTKSTDTLYPVDLEDTTEADKTSVTVNTSKISRPVNNDNDWCIVS